MKIVYFDFAAIAVLGILLFSYYFRKLTKGIANKAFLVTVYATLATTFASTIGVILDNKGTGPYALQYFAHMQYLILHTGTAFCYLCFLVSITQTWHKIFKYKVRFWLLTIPMLYILVIMIVNLFVPCVFTIENGVYTRKFMFKTLYPAGFFYLFAGVYYILHYRKVITTKTLLAVLLLYPLMFFATIFEILNPPIIIEVFSNAVALVFVSYNIQRPEEVLNSDTGFENAISYKRTNKMAFINKRPNHQILINVTNYALVRDMLGYNLTGDKVSKIIADKIYEIAEKINFYPSYFYLGNGIYRIMMKPNSKKVEQTALEINEALQQPFTINNIEVNFIACVCIVKLPEDQLDFDSLMLLGDNITAKQYTGDVLYASNLFNTKIYEQLKNMDTILERAILNKSFQVFYQPIYSLKQKKFISAEALLRLHDEEFGNIRPDVFIEAAEKNGTIHKIGQIVLEKVCQFITSDEFKELGVEYIEVNLSVAQCMQDNLPEKVLSILGKYGVNPDKINLEITETAVAQSESKLLMNLRKLVSSGIHISLDDFGSGYSNLTRLTELPLSIVKFDKSVVDQHSEAKMDIMLTHLVKMIQAMEILIVIEGIETKDVLDHFTEMKCDYIQGYFFSRPLPQNEFVEFIKNYK